MNKIVSLIIFFLVYPCFAQNKPETCVKGNPLRILIDKSDYSLTVFDEKAKSAKNPQGWCAMYPVVFGFARTTAKNDKGETVQVYDPSDKTYEGDGKTPDGIFKISKMEFRENENDWKPHGNKNKTDEDKRWVRYMEIDYPNDANPTTKQERLERYNKLLEEKKIPLDKKTKKPVGLGGGIAIHATYPDKGKSKYMKYRTGSNHEYDDQIHKRINWTNGCISMKIDDIKGTDKIKGQDDVKGLYDIVGIGTEVEIVQ